jgi:succinate dehydrogenase/fumarate reductase flavoprotein subunit
MSDEKDATRSLSRRQFVKGAAVGAVGVAAAGMLTSCGEADMAAIAPPAAECPPCPAPGVPETWDYEADVVVCGYGAAGSAAAIEAHDAGAKVLILEKKSLPGGSIGRCGGAILGAGTQVQKAVGIDDSAEKLYEWVMTSTGGLTSPDIAVTYCQNTGPNVDWLQKLGEEFGVGAPIPVEKGTMGIGGVDSTGATYEVFDFEDTPRSHWATAAKAEMGEHAGPELFTPLYAAINAKGIEALFDTALVELISNGQEVIGVKADNGGKTLYVKAKKGVVLGTGGFAYNDAMKQKYNPEMVGIQSYMTDAATGEGILAAQALGADLANMSLYYPHGGPHHVHSDPDAPYYIWGGYEPGVVGSETNPVMAETHGGVVINPEARVMNVFGAPIPRLYASGCVVGTNVFGRPGNYPGCGCYVSFAIAFGRIAGKNAAALEAWA